jgi:hypothetical protein
MGNGSLGGWVVEEEYWFWLEENVGVWLWVDSV